MVNVARFSIWRVNLNPVKGSEQSGYRPVLVISPDEMNEKLNTVIVAPMTSRLRGWPSRVHVEHDHKSGEVALDQLRTIDKVRLGRCMGVLDGSYHERLFSVLSELFTE